jgi:small subunit ribosomal protein S9
MKAYTATGRRKNAIAQVRLASPGTGKVRINDRTIEDYLPVDIHRAQILRPFEVVKMEGKFDIAITTCGGGQTGQTGAIQLGIARALVSYDETFRTTLRSYGMLTRDPRMIERKKYGLKKARKRFQFSKR